MGTVISSLKAKFGVDTSEFKKGLKDGEKATEDFTGAAGSVLDQFASMFGVQMGAVNDAIGTANKSLGFLKQSFVGAAKGGDIMAISMKVLKFALISTGIGALVVLLGSIIAYFSKSGEGADKFAKIMMQLKSVVNNVIDRLAIFGKGLWEIMTGKFKQGWEDMTGAFKGMGAEIKEDWIATGALADKLDALEDREIALITTLSERKAKAAELRQLAKEETEDQKKKLALIDQASKLYKSAYGDQIALEQERLALMKEQLAMQTSDPTDEQNRSIAEQEAKINDLIRERANELKAVVRERKTAAEAVANELALEKLKSEQSPVQTVDTGNIKMPDFNQISNQLQKYKASVAAVKKVTLDMSQSINQALSQAYEGFGEFIGNLALGNAKISDLGSLIAGVLSEMCITIGKAAIGIGVAMLAVKLAFTNPLAAIAAGVALIALGTIIKGALSKVGSGGGGGGASGVSGGSNYTYDTTQSNKNAQPQTIHITGQLTAKGNDLVYVFDQEKRRKRWVT